MSAELPRGPADIELQSVVGEHKMQFPVGYRRQLAAELRMSVAALAAGIDCRRCTLAAVLRSSPAGKTATSVV